MIPTDAESRAALGTLTHERDACLRGTLLYHSPAAKNQPIHAPIAQAVPIGQLNDRFGMSLHARDIAEQFVQTGAGEIVDMRCEVRLVQLRGAVERRGARTTRLLGKAQDPEDRRKIGEGRDFRVVNVVHRLRSMLTRVVEAQDRLELGPCLGKRPEVHGRDPGQAVAGKANKRAWKALRYLPSLVG